MLKPKLLTTLKDYNKSLFWADVSAGLIVGIVALPLAIAFAIASGVSPEKGIITAIIAGFIISALGGSRVQIGGPTGAFVIIVFNIVQQYGIAGLTFATLLAGILLIVMGFAKMGAVIKFIPHPLIVGFTSGIAVIIFSSQIKDFLGLGIASVPSEFFEKWICFFQNLDKINFYSLGLSGGSIALILLWQKFNKKIPGSLVALLAGTLIAYFFHFPVETIGSKFGEIPISLQMADFSHFTFEQAKNLVQPAVTIAILAAIEALLSAVVADGMIGGKHRSNMELIAQGAANIFSALFGGIPATGAIARTATNIKNGGKTPIAGIIHAIVLLLIMLFFGSYAKLIPLASLSAILVVVSYNMSEWRTFVHLLKSPKSDVAVLLITFILTVVIDLTVAIEVGMILAVFLFMRRMAMVTNVGIITREFNEEEVVDTQSIDSKDVPHGVEVFEINGPFFFGAVDKFKEAVNRIGKKPKVRIIRMRNVQAIDSTGLNALETLHKDCRKQNIQLILSGVHAQPQIAIEQANLTDVFGELNICANIDEALQRAKDVLQIA
jgi:SulP family sulfate permease